MSTLLLSDLHLPAGPSVLRARFITLLQGRARHASAIYILGDLFEYWVGDDAGLPVYADEIAALAELTRCGVPVYVQHGNRDFLLGRDFERATGAKLIHDPSSVLIDGEPWLLSHGDAWCADDVGYQRWRRFSRNPLAQAVFRHLPRRWRERIAGGVRSGSHQSKTSKSAAIMDVNDAAVIAGLRRARQTRTIHGHTHRPADHVLQIDGRPGERVVLADWRRDHCEILEISGGQRRRIRLD